MLGPTFDYTHRLLDTALAENTKLEAPAVAESVSRADAARGPIFWARMI